MKVANLEKIREVKMKLTRFMMVYKFALDEINTRIDILKQEFHYSYEYNPIEHVKSRLKTPESIIEKVYRRGYDLTPFYQGKCKGYSRGTNYLFLHFRYL